MLSVELLTHHAEFTLKVIYFLYDKYNNVDYVDMCTYVAISYISSNSLSSFPILINFVRFALGKYGRFSACLFMFVYPFLVSFFIFHFSLQHYFLFFSFFFFFCYIIFEFAMI